MLDAKRLGYLLALSTQEKEHLNIRTIRVFDRTDGQLKQQRKARDRARKATARHKAGMTTRQQYLATHNKSVLKPWKAAGMSRAKWYRQQANRETVTPRETSLSATNISNTRTHLSHPCQKATIKSGVPPCFEPTDRSGHRFTISLGSS